MKKGIFVLIFLGLLVFVFGQNKVTGVVYDTDGFPLEKAKVKIESLGIETITNEDGAFEFENIPNSIYQLKVQTGKKKYSFEQEVKIYGDTDLEVHPTVELFDDWLVTPKEIQLDPLNLTAKPPFTAQNVTASELNEKALGQDLPVLLKNTPSVVTTSDAGAGIGYTGLRIRGSDQTRINVTLNGVPVNDSESQGVFWVNMPDLSSSVNNIIIQRGLGTSVNGAGAFGASVNITTNDPETNPYGEISTSAGSFGTYRITGKLGTGQIAKNFYADGRVSYISSNGYIDRASSELFSYNASLMYKNDKRKLWFTTFGGREETYQAWFGIDRNTLETNRTYNPAGEIYDDAGNLTGFYEDQVDDYHQDHYQLHYDETFGNWDVNAALHYTYGRGYFEEYQDVYANQNIFFSPDNVDLAAYGIGTGTSDIIRQRWLRNHFYGGVFNVKRTFNDFKLLVGGSINRYDGDHFGNVIDVINNPSIPPTQYYMDNGIKDEQNFYIKGIYDLGNFELFGDLQYRHISYKTSATQISPVEGFTLVDEEFNFWNPKAGITYKTPFGDFYFSYALGHREPRRSDYFDNPETPEAETLHDFELGFRKSDYKKFSLNANLYYMYYENQLVLTGNVNNVGAFIRENSGKSFRAGIELDASYQLTSWLNLFGNTSLSMNENIDWQEEINGTIEDFGNTQISFSPNVIANLGFEVEPFRGAAINFINKFVGEQFMSNAEFEQSKLDSYFVSDVLFKYTPKANGFKNLTFSLLVNNIFDEEYENNGFYFNFFDGNTQDPRGLNHNPFFYPQAGINVLGGITFKF